MGLRSTTQQRRAVTRLFAPDIDPAVDLLERVRLSGVEGGREGVVVWGV